VRDAEDVARRAQPLVIDQARVARDDPQPRRAVRRRGDVAGPAERRQDLARGLPVLLDGAPPWSPPG